MMSDADYFRQLGARCRRLSHSCFDLGIAGELREMADEFERKAVDAGQHKDRQAKESDLPVKRRGRPDTRRPS